MIYNFEIFNRSHGIGGKFINQLIKDIKIQVYPRNTESKKFWGKHGFRTVDDDGLMMNV